MELYSDNFFEKQDSKNWRRIHKYLLYIEKCGFAPKRKYLIIKTYHYWTDWHIANRRPMAVKQCDRMLQ